MQETRKSQDGEFTTFVLRIDFAAFTYKSSIKRPPKKSRLSEPLCSCSQLHEIHGFHSVRDKIHGVQQPNIYTSRFILNTATSIEEAEALCTGHTVPQFHHLDEFGDWVLSLALLLANLCEGDHTSELPERGSKHGLQPFRGVQRHKRDICEDIRRLLLKPLNPSDVTRYGMGHVYLLRTWPVSSNHGALKIGFSKFHPEHRAHGLTSCYSRLRVVAQTTLLPHVRRLESIIHAELEDVRKLHVCKVCDKTHKEWFVMRQQDAREVVVRWSRWICQQPYLDGQLTRRWRDHLDAQSFEKVDEHDSLSNTWRSIIDDVPEDEIPVEEAERIQKYLWTCYCANNDTCGSRFRLGKDDVCDTHSNSSSKLKLLEARSHFKAVDGVENWVKNADRVFHPSTPSKYLQTVDGTPGQLLVLLQKQREEIRSVFEERREYEAAREDIDRSALLDSDASRGSTDFDMGDATLLPVLTLEELKRVGSRTADWIGYTPTHVGYQSLQESRKKRRRLSSEQQYEVMRRDGDARVHNLHMCDRERLVSSDSAVKDA